MNREYAVASRFTYAQYTTLLGGPTKVVHMLELTPINEVMKYESKV